MARRAPQVKCSAEEKQELERLAASRVESRQAVERARIILGCLEGKPVKTVAKQCHTRPNTVINWRGRFLEYRLKGLADARRPGPPKALWRGLPQAGACNIGKTATTGQAIWDGVAVAKVVNGSEHAVWRVLRKEGICLQRQRSWCVSTDKEFAAKAADIVGLYLNPPEKALVICVDEKPSIQALERATGYVESDSGKIVRGFKSTYKRHGTLNLFAALQVSTGQVNSKRHRKHLWQDSHGYHSCENYDIYEWF